MTSDARLEGPAARFHFALIIDNWWRTGGATRLLRRRRRQRVFGYSFRPAIVLVFDDRCEKAVDNNCGEQSLQHAALNSAKVMVFLIYPDQQILERSVVTDATDTTTLKNAGASECCQVDLSSVLDGDRFGVKLCRAGDEAQNNTGP